MRLSQTMGGMMAMEIQGQTEIVGDVAAEVGFVDEEGFDLGAAGCFRAVAEHHAGGVGNAFEREAEAGQAVELAEMKVEFLERSGRVSRFRR